jgi:hypothetical protein
MGIKHVRGMVLYGPPGNGKTLIARAISTKMTTNPVKIVNGPEIMNKFVGASEENVRKLFEEARIDQKKNGDRASLHVIVIDEIDAICGQRSGGSDVGTSVHNAVVAQLLSMIDGVDSLDNILVIGMTNQFDMLDKALLRPGRLEVNALPLFISYLFAWCPGLGAHQDWLAGPTGASRHSQDPHALLGFLQVLIYRCGFAWTCGAHQELFRRRD